MWNCGCPGTGCECSGGTDLSVENLQRKIQKYENKVKSKRAQKIHPLVQRRIVARLVENEFKQNEK